MPTVVPNAQKTHNFSEIWGTAWLGRRQHDIHSEDEFVLDEPFNGNIERQPVHRGTTADTVVTDEWRRYTGQPVPLALFFFFFYSRPEATLSPPDDHSRYVYRVLVFAISAESGLALFREAKDCSGESFKMH